MAKQAGENADQRGSTITDALSSAFDHHVARHGVAVVGADGYA